MENRQKAGVILFVGAFQFIIGMLLAELLYPGYSVSGNYISDLGATCRDTCVIYQPSATIFNSSVILLGIFILVGTYFIWQEFQNNFMSVLLVLTGAGAIGVGVFPETAGKLHFIVSAIAFLFGALSAIYSYKLVKVPYSYFSVLMGIMSLIAFILMGFETYLGLGQGGMERMIAYPVLLWGLSFGSYLMSPE